MTNVLLVSCLSLAPLLSVAAPTLLVTSPKEYQVIQRKTAATGYVPIHCEVRDAVSEPTSLEARFVVKGEPQPWREFNAGEAVAWQAPAGGWHRFEIRARFAGTTFAQTVVEHFGIGEIFVIAGQSNAGNHGRDKQITKTGLVSSFDGEKWRIANDPQPGATGDAGSFAPVFADAIVDRFGLPVGIVACAVGGTSVREWLPRGEKFPQPPTILANVAELPGGGWQSRGRIYGTFLQRMKDLGPGPTFRAVLWHQGESDANQEDSTRTLPGELYSRYLEQLIKSTRTDLGWAVPWFVAQASYHTPSDPGSADIRAAQAALWRSGMALEGPDTDQLKTEFRASNGRGVHFNGAGLQAHARLWFDKVAPWLEQQVRPIDKSISK